VRLDKLFNRLLYCAHKERTGCTVDKVSELCAHHFTSAIDSSISRDPNQCGHLIVGALIHRTLAHSLMTVRYSPEILFRVNKSQLSDFTWTEQFLGLYIYAAARNCSIFFSVQALVHTDGLTSVQRKTYEYLRSYEQACKPVQLVNLLNKANNGIPEIRREFDFSVTREKKSLSTCRLHVHRSWWRWQTLQLPSQQVPQKVHRMPKFRSVSTQSFVWLFMTVFFFAMVCDNRELFVSLRGEEQTYSPGEASLSTISARLILILQSADDSSGRRGSEVGSASWSSSTR